MKILLVSDHEESYIWDHFDHDRFKEVDVILSCGDLKAEYLSFLVTLIKAPLFYIPGNHDSKYLTKPPEGCISIDNKLIIYNNIRILGIGGSMKYNNGAFQYTERQMKRRVLKLKPKIWWHSGFDILVTHSPAFKLGDGEDLCHLGFEVFRELLDSYMPKYHVHGHQHLCYGNQSRIIKYKSTTIINASGYHLFDF